MYTNIVTMGIDAAENFTSKFVSLKFLFGQASFVIILIMPK